jgi:osmotically-inducible protein OsmY
MVRDGKAILTGTVKSWQERRAVEHAAWAWPDIREIDDRLVVISGNEP